MDADAEMIMRLRSAQDMVRLLLGNADAAEADAVIKLYAVRSD
jgi:hypothetical protein